MLPRNRIKKVSEAIGAPSETEVEVPSDLTTVGSREGAIQRYKPNERQCALLTLALVAAKEAEVGHSISRCRIAEISLRRLWCRNRIAAQFLDGVCEWLEGSGVILFYAGSSYGLVRLSVVEGWSRLTSKRLLRDLAEVEAGTYNFDRLDHLLSRSPVAAGSQS